MSIQSLISSPPPPPPPPATTTETGFGERGMKRKGSDIADRDDDDAAAADRSSRGTSVVSATGLSMEDPDVRDAVEALGGLKAGKSPLPPPPPGPSAG